MTNISSDFSSIFEAIHAGQESKQATIEGFFKKEYQAITGEELDLTEVPSGEAEYLKIVWESYLRGGDPFGLHKMGSGSVAEALSQLSNDRLVVIWELFDKLVELTRSIQNSAIALAKGAQYTSKTQRAIVDKISEIDPSDFGTETEAEEKQAITTTKQAQIDNLRSLRTLERGDGDQWTSALSSANESAQNQSQLLALIVRQMSGIVSAIFR